MTLKLMEMEMTINDKILETLTEFNIKKDDAICYLLSLYYGYKPTYFPDDFKSRMNTTKIYEADNKTLKWNIPLFEGQVTKFSWVENEYVPLFKEANDARGGHVRESIARIKKLFAKNPEIRDTDVIGAAKMYIRNTDSKYIMFPHYFIEKGKGGEKTQTILTWIEKYQLSLEQVERTEITNQMQ